jgi:hypothetical protein
VNDEREAGVNVLLKYSGNTEMHSPKNQIF